MFCLKCGKILQRDYKYCPECGAVINWAALNGYSDVYGAWDVTAESDCTGEDSKFLGTFSGYIDEIALWSWHLGIYSLRFNRASEEGEKVHYTGGGEVNIKLGIDSGTWRLSPDDLIKIMQELFKGRPVKVSKGDYCASIKITK